MSNPTFKVKIQNGYEIMVDGVQVGYLDGSREVYVVLGGNKWGPDRGTSVARFKRYLHKSTAKTLATRWVKFVLARMTVAEILVRLNPADFNKKTSPMHLAWELGYPKPEVPRASSSLTAIPSPKTWEEAAQAPVIFITA